MIDSSISEIPSNQYTLDIHQALIRSMNDQIDTFKQAAIEVENRRQKVVNYARQAAIVHGIDASEWDAGQWSFEPDNKRFVRVESTIEPKVP
jgi:hypothetical protein